MGRLRHRRCGRPLLGKLKRHPAVQAAARAAAYGWAPDVYLSLDPIDRAIADAVIERQIEFTKDTEHGRAELIGAATAKWIGRLLKKK